MSRNACLYARVTEQPVGLVCVGARGLYYNDSMNGYYRVASVYLGSKVTAITIRAIASAYGLVP